MRFLNIAKIMAVVWCLLWVLTSVAYYGEESAAARGWSEFLSYLAYLTVVFAGVPVVRLYTKLVKWSEKKDQDEQ
jgi:hypothetical protein